MWFNQPKKCIFLSRKNASAFNQKKWCYLPSKIWHSAKKHVIYPEGIIEKEVENPYEKCWFHWGNDRHFFRKSPLFCMFCLDVCRFMMGLQLAKIHCFHWKWWMFGVGIAVGWNYTYHITLYQWKISPRTEQELGFSSTRNGVALRQQSAKRPLLSGDSTNF